MVQKIESEGTAERVAGLKGPDRSQEPTASAPEFPASVQDRERNKFRPSRWKRLTQMAVSNDDGSPITEGLEDLLVELLEETRKNNDLTGKLLATEGTEAQPLIPFFDSGVTSTSEPMILGPATLYFLEIQNPNSADAWLQLFDTETVVVGTTRPTLSIFVPGLGATDKFWAGGVRFQRAIRYAATTTATGSTAPTSNLVVNGGYV